MSIYKIVESDIDEAKKTYSDLLTGKKGDMLDGCAFMLYALNIIFPEFENEDIDGGIVDSCYRSEQHDYGIDAIYVTANKELVLSSDQLQDYNEDTKFVMHILQFKKGRGVDQADLLKLKEGIKRIIINEDNVESDNKYLFDYSLGLNDIKKALFESKTFSTSQINIKIQVVFGGMAETLYDNPLLSKQVSDFKQLLVDSGYIYNTFEAIGALELIDLKKQGKEIVDIINYIESMNYISETQDKKLNGYIWIAKGSEISKLVKTYQSSLFEANIRDYYTNDLNKKIFDTAVDKEESKFFWSFNNGLTITSRKVEELPNHKFRLYGMQIVNGCQTSYTLYQAALKLEKFEKLQTKIALGEDLDTEEKLLFTQLHGNTLSADTTLLIKIVETNDLDLTYKITEATNTQTPIKTFSLKANEYIQKLIEEYLKEYSIYYERRINFYRNQGIKSTVSIQHLFQLYMAQIKFKPSIVRAAQKAIFVGNYDDVFPNPKIRIIDYSLYLVPIKVDASITRFIKKLQREKSETDGYMNTLYTYGKLQLGPLVLSSILAEDYDEKNIIKRHKEIIKILDNDSKFEPHFRVAAENLKKLIKSVVGNKKEAIPSAVRKAELDAKIVRLIKKA